MNDQRLDCRGMACPHPVLKAKELVDRGDVAQMSVLVDNPAAKENVSRFLARAGYSVHVVEQGEGFEIKGERGAASSPCELPVDVGQEAGKTAVVIATECLGRGDDVLGAKLAVNFIGTLKEMGQELWRLIFLNGGVKLTAEGSAALAALRELEKEGVYILVCGTCLNHFGLLEKKQVGETTNMLDIVTALQLADKVISMT
jgi:selenium metabolism protein YedF